VYLIGHVPGAADATFINGQLVERPGANDQQEAA
jgi:hypothetical protein